MQTSVGPAPAGEIRIEPWRWQRREDLVFLAARLGPARLAFSSRAGGVSPAPFASLNLGGGLGDDDANVARNRERLLRGLGLGGRPVHGARQVHGAHAIVVGEGAPAVAPEADALVTRVPSAVLLLRFADCVPVFLAAPGPVAAVALAHAGWRGLAAGVVEAAVDALTRTAGASEASLVAAIGPAIGPSYEVDEPVMAALRGRYAQADRWWGADGVLDMTRGVREALLGRGLDRVHIVETAERTESPAFFSHRASGGRTGRMAGVIWLDDGCPGD
jgi:hypothetical protein